MKMSPSLIVFFISILGILGCSFDRDPGLSQSVTIDLQLFFYDNIGATAYTAFQNNPCIVLRFCGEQVGCNETFPKKMDFNLVQKQGEISFDLSLALFRKYRFQLLGHSDAGGSCQQIGAQAIQLGVRDSVTITPVWPMSFKISPNYQPAGNFEKILGP